ncbi:3'-5' exoribonuclease YhaM [Aciduricibacillus chroicocephali]|uniref:3'-5' exoribonuclease YhaM n=1 Tax=Aciduricibacillus chroicocephali TaxID=3054939 RepID=A0ABY9KXF7_9BACI|nr:3'-5' exoribonuclease YhaM [Bacillaceae bacterium 44XB]
MAIGKQKVGEIFEGFALIKDVKKGTTSGGKPFLTLVFGDQTGEMEAKLWDSTKEDEQLLLPESIVLVNGEIGQFRGKAQMRINAIRPAQPTDGVHIADFIEKAPVAVEELKDRIMEAIFEMKNPNLQRIVRAFVKKYEENLFLYPAASRNHHEYTSGLAHHIVGMLGLAKGVHDLHPEIDRDLLYAGIILHDIGKLRELSGVISTSYTTEGKLLGHISIMVEEIAQMARELQIEGEEVLVLQHMVLSHHGKAEWGSPKPPMIREAEILHLIDLMDARLNMLGRVLENTAPGEFTERIFSLEQRSFYKPAFSVKTELDA